MENNENEIKLTPLQRAKKKYYEKIKNDPNYRANINRNCLNHYHAKLKNDDEYKKKVSEKKREYYFKKKTEKLLEIIL
jgi:transcriptional accessory protein Tex/SPT6